MPTAPIRAFLPRPQSAKNTPSVCNRLVQFSGTTGVSANNRGPGFVPAFMDIETGNFYLSRFANDMPAPIHVLAGLPDYLTEAHGESAAALSIKSSIISGSVREETFYSRE